MISRIQKLFFPITWSGLIGSSLILVFCFGCKPTPKIEAIELDGQWELVEATRNNRKTSTLEQAYFKFLPDGNMETNILGDDLAVPYQLNGSTIEQLGENPIFYTLERLEGDTLILSATINNYDFKFTTLRANVDLKEDNHDHHRH